jgi:hypothetical protein
MEGLGSHRELDDSSRALDGIDALMIWEVLEDVTCDSELCDGSVFGGVVGVPQSGPRAGRTRTRRPWSRTEGTRGQGRI